MYKEPTALIGVISAAIAALIGLGVAFGLDLSDEQQNAILGAIGPVVIIIAVMTAAIRAKVYSPATRDADVAAASTTGDELT